MAERNIDISRPSTSQHTTYQPLRIKTSVCNKIKDPKASCSPKNSPRHRTSTRQKELQDETHVAIRSVANSSLNDISAQCQRLGVNDPEEVEQADNTTFPKRKNARKKAKFKELKMPNHPQTLPELIEAQPPILNYNDCAMNDLFSKQIAPMYETVNYRYLENVSHHPHFKLNMQHYNNMQQIHFATSLPSTPIAFPNLLQLSTSAPNSPILVPGNNSPHFIQNVMQHPLLSQSHILNTSKNTRLNNSHMRKGVDESNQSLRGCKINKKNERVNPDDVKFESYLPVEKVNEGLKDKIFIEGVLRINPKQFQHSYVSSSDRDEQDVLIDGLKNRNRALEGDIVIVQLIDSDSEDNNEETQEIKQKKGKIVFIKEIVHPRTCIGILKIMPDKNKQKALFVPRDHRIPRLNIPFIYWPDNFYENEKMYEKTLFSAKIIHWTDTRFALGKIIGHIGQSGDMISETKAILAQTDLDVTPYGPDVRHLYPRLDYIIPESEIELREDCRHLCLFSIDPSNCRDIDDAVSCTELENGNYEIGVHISDVSHFLTENTLLDEKVADKATTIYLVERAYHMLPDDLCTLCSLFAGVDKLAFSVFWEISNDGQVLHHRFSKTIIHSCCQLSYDNAQAILEDREANFPEIHNSFKYEDIYKSIKILGKLSSVFRKKRFDCGALRIDQPKVSFTLSAQNGLPETFYIYESKESHQLIEEFMLLANMTVAKKIYDDHPKLAFLRSHPPPSGYMMRQLAKALKPMGIDLNISSAGDLYQSLLPYVNSESHDKGKAIVLSMLCAKPMTRAKYLCADGCEYEDFHHYALNVPLYTHFTSPIRRYADIMVHRLLSASLKYREVPKWEIDKVRMIAAQCNKQKYNAKRAGELSMELYMLKYIQINSPVVTEAVVVEVRQKYIDVIIVAMGLNRRIFFNDFPGEFQWIEHEGGNKLAKMELTWRKTDNLPELKQTIEVFSILQVEMNKGDDMVKVDTKLVRPQQTVPS